MTKDEALKLALDWLESGNFVYPTGLRAAIKEALAQPEQEATCPECKAAVLYECVACSSNNYPPKPEQEPVAYAGVKVWVGNQQVVQLLTQTELHYAVEPWLLVELNALKCVKAMKELNT